LVRKKVLVICIILSLILSVLIFNCASVPMTFTEYVDTENDVILFSKREYNSTVSYHPEMDITSVNVSLGIVELVLKNPVVIDVLHYYGVDIYWEETDNLLDINKLDSNRTICTFLGGQRFSDTYYVLPNGSFLFFDNHTLNYQPNVNVIQWYYDFSLFENFSIPNSIIVRTVFPYSFDFVFNSILPEDDLYVDYYPNDYHSFQTFQTVQETNFFTNNVFVTLYLLFSFKIYLKKKRK